MAQAPAQEAAGSSSAGGKQGSAAAAKGGGRKAQWRGKQHVLAVLNEYIEEFDRIVDQIVEQAPNFIHANEVILTLGYSSTVMRFLKAAASGEEDKKRRHFQVVVAEGEAGAARGLFPGAGRVLTGPFVFRRRSLVRRSEHGEGPHVGGHHDDPDCRLVHIRDDGPSEQGEAMEESAHNRRWWMATSPLAADAGSWLDRAGCQPKGAAASPLPPADQVVIGASALLANGGLLAPVGAHVVAQAAKAHAVPVVVLVGSHKVSPVFPHEPGAMGPPFPQPPGPSTSLNRTA